MAPQRRELNDGPSFAQFHFGLMERIAALPGVAAALTAFSHAGGDHYMLANYIPAYRPSSVDPLEALRDE